VNSQVVRSSAGAVNYLPLARVPDLAAAVSEMRACGVAVYAASERGEQLIGDVNLRGSVAVIIGNEGVGISAELWPLCAGHVRIPMVGPVGSLNAAVAAGIVCYELARQRHHAVVPKA
jgi:23S rRNA (guanosine2251-2'-O)-methyltransferase